MSAGSVSLPGGDARNEAWHVLVVTTPEAETPLPRWPAWTLSGKVALRAGGPPVLPDRPAPAPALIQKGWVHLLLGYVFEHAVISSVRARGFAMEWNFDRPNDRTKFEPAEDTPFGREPQWPTYGEMRDRLLDCRPAYSTLLAAGGDSLVVSAPDGTVTANIGVAPLIELTAITTARTASKRMVRALADLRYGEPRRCDEDIFDRLDLVAGLNPLAADPLPAPVRLDTALIEAIRRATFGAMGTAHRDANPRSISAERLAPLRSRLDAIDHQARFDVADHSVALLAELVLAALEDCARTSRAIAGSRAAFLAVGRGRRGSGATPEMLAFLRGELADGATIQGAARAGRERFHDSRHLDTWRRWTRVQRREMNQSGS